jgi:hypothetical protein
MDDLSSRYQLPENVAGAGEVEVDAELIDFATGLELIDPDDQEQLTGETFSDIILVNRPDIISLVVVNDESRAAPVDVTNRQQGEVDTSLLGIERAEVALNLFDTVNIYGINSKEWTTDPGGGFRYTYYRDPSDYTFQGNFGAYTRHLAPESALQAYCFPPPTSFSYPIDDNTGRFPGGFTNGVMTTYWQSKRAFRYQPGRVTGFTMGVRMSANSGYKDEVIQWGCRNDYGDGYYFQLEKGTDLYIIYKRRNPNGNIEEIKIPRLSWNGDQVSLNQASTGWILDVSRVTMFKIEFSWYGAVGAKFFAYVPVGHGEARWVLLHYVIIENQLEVPSLRSAFMKMFTQCRTTAGTTKAAFINLYGSSVYIDGGDKGTVTVGTAPLANEKTIDTTSRSILGLQVEGQINGVDNQKAVYPVNLAAYASVPARFDLVLQSNGTGAGESYFYGNATNLTRGASASIAVSGNGSQWNGTFPSGIVSEISGSTNYLSGRRVRVVGAGIYNTHVVSASPTQITTDRSLPDSTTSIRLSRFDAYAVASGVIDSGTTEGAVFFNTGGGQWRLGAWVQSSGQPYSDSEDVVWFASKYTGLNFDRNGNVIGERAFPFEPYRQTSFSIEFPSGTSNTVINFGGQSRTLTGVTNPWPISLVAEVMDSSQLNDVVVASGFASGVTTPWTIPGSGGTAAIAQWDAVSGVTQNSSSAGGTTYVANKFEASSSDPLSAVLVDTQGYRVLKSPQRIGTYFLGSGETKQFDLSNLFGPDKMFITGQPGTVNNSGALFVVATARTGSGVASATLNWEEQ